MKPTKNQADAVRNYLATLGFEISHVQALEVIARGAGYRSRHVAQKSQESVKPILHSCSQCGSELNPSGYCKDQTCAYSDWPQIIPRNAFTSLTTAAIESLFEVKKRVNVETPIPGEVMLPPLNGSRPPVSMRLLEYLIRQEYVESGCQRSDLAHAVHRLLSDCSEVFDSEEAAVAFLLESPEESAAEEENDRQLSLAEGIKSEYDQSSCDAKDVDHAVSRLMAECPQLFATDRHAWSFINEEPHEDLESTGTDYVLMTYSDTYGSELYTYTTIQKRNSALIRLMAKAVELNDSVNRQYFFAEVSDDLETDSVEYEAALESKELHGDITDNVVTYEGTVIGSIDKLTEGGLTLYSWIEESDAED